MKSPIQIMAELIKENNNDVDLIYLTTEIFQNELMFLGKYVYYNDSKGYDCFSCKHVNERIQNLNKAIEKGRNSNNDKRVFNCMGMF